MNAAQNGMAGIGDALVPLDELAVPMDFTNSAHGLGGVAAPGGGKNAGFGGIKADLDAMKAAQNGGGTWLVVAAAGGSDM